MEGTSPPARLKRAADRRGLPLDEVLGVSRPGALGHHTPAIKGPGVIASEQVPFLDEYPDGVSSKRQHEWPDVRADDIDTAWSRLSATPPMREANVAVRLGYRPCFMGRNGGGRNKFLRNVGNACVVRVERPDGSHTQNARSYLNVLGGSNPAKRGEEKLVDLAVKYNGSPLLRKIQELVLTTPAEIPIRLHFPEYNGHHQKQVLMRMVATIERANLTWSRRPFLECLEAIKAAKKTLRDDMMAAKGKHVLKETGRQLKVGETLVDVGVEAVNEMNRQPRPRETAVAVVCVICGWTEERVPTAIIQHKKSKGPCFSRLRLGWHYILKDEISSERYPDDNIYLRWLNLQISTLVRDGPGKTLDKREATDSFKDFVKAQAPFPGSGQLVASLEDLKLNGMESLFRVLERIFKRAATSMTPVTLPGNPRLAKVKYTVAEAAASVGTGHHVSMSDSVTERRPKGRVSSKLSF
ncbi:hypothetical protein HK101_008575 [Irineochytrium annulatum]|nr:hypothetical protein HK101_008575 [Irineochytrium annulatum]